MDAAEQEAARANEQTRLNASAKGFRSQFVSTRKVLMQALPLYAEGATARRRRTIDEAIARIGLQADKVQDAYQRHIKFDDDERHHVTFETRQDNTATEHNDIPAHANEVLREADGPQHRQQQPRQVQGDIVAATVAAMNAANGGNAGLKKINYHLKPKILGKDFTTSELRTWCSGMVCVCKRVFSEKMLSDTEILSGRLSQIQILLTSHSIQTHHIYSI
jgi:ribosomal protein L11